MMEQLAREYKFKTELHAHTAPVSTCSHIPPEKLVEMYREEGVDSVVLTNHFLADYLAGDSAEEQLKGYLDAWKLAQEYGEKRDVCVLLGMEIRFTQNINDYLVYGIGESDVYKAYSYFEKGIEKFYREFKNEENLIFQAHPFRNDMVLAGPENLDGIEIFNLHPNHNSRVGIAARYAQENGLLVCGGTDFHEEGHQGLCLIRTKRRMENSFDIAQVIRSGEFLFDISGNLALPYYFAG